MKHPLLEKGYAKFSFEDFLQDDYFISSIKKPDAESKKFWEQFRKENQNLENFEAAKDWIESINQYHDTLSPTEVDEIRQGINKKNNPRKQTRRFYYWYAGIAAAACIAFVMLFKFLDKENIETLSYKLNITSFADIHGFDAKEKDIQLVLPDERTIHLDQEEAVITHDTTGIVVDKYKEVIAQSDNEGFNQLIVPYGKRVKLNLSDGTSVWVNSGSRLIYPVVFEDEGREVFVEGEIYIEVAEDNARSFTVKTKDVDVRVLGTKFNVSAYEVEKEIIVLVSGAVQIISKKDENITDLLPNQMYWSENGQSHVKVVDTRKYISWIDGIYFCEKESLGAILQKLSVFYGVEIVCEPSISKVIFSGKLDLKENLSDIIDGISFTIPISYAVENGKYTISKIK